MEPQSETQPKTQDRLLFIDLFRGLAILAVIGIHVLGAMLPRMWNQTFRWKLIALTDIALQFAVPSFLMLSALLLTRSLLKKFDLKQYAKTRLTQTLPPYLIWSSIYLLLPENRQDFTPIELVGRVLIGKASFHLYFLFVLLQLYILVPLVLRVWRRRLPFWQVLLAIVGLTLAVYWTNKLLIGFKMVASVVLWYLPSIVLGMWLGSRSDRLSEILRRGIPLATLLAVVGAVPFFSLSLKQLLRQPISSYHFQVGNWLYATAMGFVVLWLAEVWSRKKFGVQALLELGKNSLPIYIIHPLLLYYLKQWYAPATLRDILFAILLYSVVCICVPLLLARLATKLRLSALLFGRG